MDGEILDGGELAVAMFRGDQDESLVGERDERDDLIARRQADTPHAGCIAAHRTHVVLIEADGLAAARAQDDLPMSVGDVDTDETIALLELDGNDARLAWTREGIE
jgi:hypothetical protein